MKKIVFSLIALFVALPFVWAVPADPTPYKYTQPDGTVIVLQNHGDEFFHWITNESGQVVKKGADGFYRPTGESVKTMVAQASQSRTQRLDSWSSYDNPPVTNFGDRKVLCIIANFSDVAFSLENPNAHFTNMLNQSGYNAYGAHGSVRDYYRENSHDKYRPQFDVYGPVTLSNTSAYYDGDDYGVTWAIKEAYDLLVEGGSDINISDYDTDNDGNVDMVLFYYPGYNEAEGGDETTIWPHQWSGNFGYFGESGIRLVRYFCTSELKGNEESNPDKDPASIGTTCHEFAHSLGLPDFYDTDYAANGGQNNTTGPYDLMASGSYNDSGRRPPYLSAVERNILGWMPTDNLVGLATTGDYALEPVQNDKAYQFASTYAGEYFVLEYRNGSGWDSAIPEPGMLVYHIDKADRTVPGSGRTAADLWEGNSINAYGGHPCFYLVSTLDSPTSWRDFAFPGPHDVDTYIPYGWDENQVPMVFSQIAHDGTAAGFHLEVSTARRVFGTVTDTSGNPMEGVQVSLTPSTVPFNSAPSLLNGSIFCMTDENGYYSLELEDEASANQILLAQYDGYISTSVNLSISSLMTSHDITMLRWDEAQQADLSRFDSSYYLWNWGLGSGPLAVGMRYTPEELAAADVVGGQIQKISFYCGANQGEKVSVVVNIGDERVLCRDVTAQYQPDQVITVNVADANIIIPSDKNIFIGYGLKDIATDYPFAAFGGTPTNNGGGYIDRGFPENAPSYDEPLNDEDGYYDFFVSAVVNKLSDLEFSVLGVSFIKVEAGVPTVEVAAGKSLRDITWYLDGEEVSTPTAIADLAAGSHTYLARVRYYDGTAERIYFDVDKD